MRPGCSIKSGARSSIFLTAKTVVSASNEIWPALPFAQWKATAKTLHMWTQIVGKIRMQFTPWINHSWHVTLYVSARGLTTSPIYSSRLPFEMEFDFEDHQL